MVQYNRIDSVDSAATDSADPDSADPQVVRKITFRGPMIVGRQILAGWQAVESATRPRESALRNLSILQSS